MAPNIIPKGKGSERGTSTGPKKSGPASRRGRKPASMSSERVELEEDEEEEESLQPEPKAKKRKAKDRKSKVAGHATTPEPPVDANESDDQALSSASKAMPPPSMSKKQLGKQPEKSDERGKKRDRKAKASTQGKKANAQISKADETVLGENVTGADKGERSGYQDDTQSGDKAKKGGESAPELVRPTDTGTPSRANSRKTFAQNGVGRLRGANGLECSSADEALTKNMAWTSKNSCQILSKDIGTPWEICWRKLNELAAQHTFVWANNYFTHHCIVECFGTRFEPGSEMYRAARTKFLNAFKNFKTKTIGRFYGHVTQLGKDSPELLAWDVEDEDDEAEINEFIERTFNETNFFVGFKLLATRLNWDDMTSRGQYYAEAFYMTMCKACLAKIHANEDITVKNQNAMAKKAGSDPKTPEGSKLLESDKNAQTELIHTYFLFALDKDFDVVGEDQFRFHMHIPKGRNLDRKIKDNAIVKHKIKPSRPMPPASPLKPKEAEPKKKKAEPKKKTADAKTKKADPKTKDKDVEATSESSKTPIAESSKAKKKVIDTLVDPEVESSKKRKRVASGSEIGSIEQTTRKVRRKGGKPAAPINIGSSSMPSTSDSDEEVQLVKGSRRGRKDLENFEEDDDDVEHKGSNDEMDGVLADDDDIEHNGSNDEMDSEVEDDDDVEHKGSNDDMDSELEDDDGQGAGESGRDPNEKGEDNEEQDDLA